MRWLVWILGCELFTVAAQPPSPAPSAEQAMRLVASGRATEAEQMLTTLERANPGDVEIQYRLGLVLLRNGKPKPALRRLESAAKRASDPLVWLALAQARLRLDDLSGALAAAGHAGLGAPSQPALARALILFDAEVIKYHLRKGEAPQALDLSKQALAKSNLAVFHNLLGQAHELNHDPSLAAAELQQAIR